MTMLSHFHPIPESRVRQTDGRIAISRVSELMRDKKWLGHMLRSESLLRTVLEGKMEGTRTRGILSATIIDWM